MDKIFVLDNFKIVLDKKYFVRADGWGIYLNKLDDAEITGIIYSLIWLRLRTMSYA